MLHRADGSARTVTTLPAHRTHSLPPSGEPLVTDSPTPRPRRSLSWLRALIPWALVGAGVVWLLGTFGSRSAMPEGEPAPMVKVALRGGGELDLAASRGDVVVLNFWASWCPPCRAEAPVLARAHERLEREGGARLVGLAMDARSLPFASRLGMTYPQGLVTREIAEAYRVEMLPTTVVVGRDGRIVWSYVGELRESELNDVLDAALEAPRP